MLILGIETTCDETGVGIVRDGSEVLASVVVSSANIHEKYGGIVPEVAAREQVKVIVPAIAESLSQARCTLFDIDAIAVAHGPGLIGPLLVGVETAKSLAISLDKSLIAVNHLVGHVYANWLNRGDGSELRARGNQFKKTQNYRRQTPKFPLVALIVSGGHTDLILMKYHCKFVWLGGTRDDAAGEVFDKVARSLGLKYPGGPEIEQLASSAKYAMPNFQFPRPMICDDNFDFSFSGLKTSVVNLVNGRQLIEKDKAQIATLFQKAIVETLVFKTIKAAQKFNAVSIVVGGGVAANSYLRKEMENASKALGPKTYFPQKAMAVDNGAMIAAAAFYVNDLVDPLKLFADSSLYF